MSRRLAAMLPSSSVQTAKQASHLLSKLNIKFAIAGARKTIEVSTMIRADEVARRWWGIDKASPADCHALRTS